MSFSKKRHIQESNLRLEKRLLSEAGQSTRINNPKLASTLKNYGKGSTGTFTSKGTTVNFVFPDKQVVTLNVQNFMGIPSGTWKINGTFIEFVG
jgi:hypothetical protein